MRVDVHEIGRSKSKVLVIDDFLADAQKAVAAAVALPAFPPEGQTAYPGRRHQIGPGDKASAHVVDVLRGAAPLVRSHYGAERFTVFEASFSLVTTPIQAMSPVQSVPHYDRDDAGYLAILLHLHHVPDTGTAFYRHLASDLEYVTPEKAPELRSLVKAELDDHASRGTPPEGRSSANYEKIFHVEGRFNRLVIYQGRLLHSAYFPPDFTYSSDPATGRLTANVFIQTA